MIPDPILFFRRLAVNIFYLGEALVYGIPALTIYGWMRLNGRRIRQRTLAEKREKEAMFARFEERHKRLWG